MTPPDRNSSISFFANLFRITEITWSIFVLLKAISYPQTSFGLKIYTKCSNLLLSESKFLICCQNSSISFFNKIITLGLICYNLTISITCSILLSFLVTFTGLCLKIPHILILPSYLYNFQDFLFPS